MKTAFNGFLAALLIALTLNGAALAQGGSSLGGGAIGTTTDGGKPDEGALEKLKQATEKTRPDGSVIAKDGSIQFPDSSILRKAPMGDDWEPSVPGCDNAGQVEVKPAVKECRADAQDGKPYFFEIQYMELTCPDLTPRYRRLAISFKKIGPCSREDYDKARYAAEQTYGEKWTPTEVVFNPPGDGTGDGKGGDGGDQGSQPTADNANGWVPRTIAFEDKFIEVIWEGKEGKQWTAVYYPDGKSAWSYKGDNPEYPTENPPPLPKTFSGRKVEFKTAKTSEPSKTDEIKKASAPGGTDKPAPHKKGKKGGAPAASTARSDPGSQPDVSALIGTGVAIGVGVGASRRGGGMPSDHRMGGPSAATSRQIKSGGAGAVRSTRSTAVTRPGVSQTINTRVGTPTISGGGFRVGF